MEELKRQLKELRGNNQLKPDSVWINNNKRVLMSQIENQTESFSDNKKGG